MLNDKNSERVKTSEKVHNLLIQFDQLCKEDKRDFLMQIWEKSCNDIVNDVFTKELMMKMCGDMMKNGPLPAFVESFFKNK